MRILVLIDYYLPGFKAGGAVRSAGNLVEALGSDMQFFVITRDRDFTDAEPYKGIDTTSWVQCGKAQVHYVRPRLSNLLAVWRAIRSCDYDVLYLNSVFSPKFSVVPLLLRHLSLLPKRPVVVAARGELNSAALRLKRLKKSVFLEVANRIGLYGDVMWQASSEIEAEDIRTAMSLPHARDVTKTGADRIMVAPDLLSRMSLAMPQRKRQEDLLRIVFCSRITRMKNLDYALRVLQGVFVAVGFDIIGPIDDHAYWRECKELIQNLPKAVLVRYLGALPNEQVRPALSDYDLLFLPTQGENFGHVILEALASGVPVLISDRTPWRQLRECNAGWDLPLDSIACFRSAVEACAGLAPLAREALRAGAIALAKAALEDERPRALSRDLFLHAAGELRGELLKQSALLVSRSEAGRVIRNPSLESSPPE